MSRGRRYEQEPKLNIKKVIAVIVAIIVVVMCIYMIGKILKREGNQSRISSKEYFAVFENNKWGVIDSSGNKEKKYYRLNM